MSVDWRKKWMNKVNEYDALRAENENLKRHLSSGEYVKNLETLCGELVGALAEAKDFIADGSYHNWEGLDRIEAVLTRAQSVLGRKAE